MIKRLAWMPKKEVRMVGNIGTDYSNKVTEYRQQVDTKGKSAKDNADTRTDDKKTESGAVYEKSSQNLQKATYSVNKMSKEDREALVRKLQSALEQQQSQLVSLVNKTLAGQAGIFGKANGNDNNSIWRTLASGNFTVDAATKAQAQKDISEDGYFGVKQTSQRLFDFASALAGDDVEKMKKMQSAMEKGFKQAEKTWGGSLPAICRETMNAAGKMFEDYYKSKETEAQNK